MRFAMIACLACSCVCATARAEERWYPSKYGAEDTLGAIHNLAPERVLEAAKLIRTGKTYALGIETGPDTPAYPPRSYQIVTTGGLPLGSNQGTGHDDLVVSWMGVGTQLDGLGHVGIDHRYYNGHPGSEILTPTGLKKLGTHEVPPIVTRGVLLDIAGLAGVPHLKEGQAIGPEQLEAASRRQGVEIGRADVVILHTGWQRFASQDPERFLGGMPGLSNEGARWLAKKRVVAVGADTWGLDVLPPEKEGEVFPVHQILLAKHGIYILENIRTDQLVADQGWEFLFVLGQPKFVGAVQMVVNPVAIR